MTIAPYAIAPLIATVSAYLIPPRAPSFPRRREPRIPVPCLCHSSEGWNPGKDEGGAPRVSTVGNATKCNRIKSFATPAHSYEANQGHHQGRLAHRVRVGGVPNETTPAPFSVSRLGVNRAKQGQLGPVLPPRRSRAAAEKGGLINSEQLPERRAGRRRRVECVIIVAAYRRWAGGRRMCNGRISQMSGLR